ncbi:hypothetical protein BC629DRAFT_1440114 [Irpex lacteus]|nr:hypothetical protein BC629DRAFT_1440114 [Irpex lacteus]
MYVLNAVEQDNEPPCGHIIMQHKLRNQDNLDFEFKDDSSLAAAPDASVLSTKVQVQFVFRDQEKKAKESQTQNASADKYKMAVVGGRQVWNLDNKKISVPTLTTSGRRRVDLPPLCVHTTGGLEVERRTRWNSKRGPSLAPPSLEATNLLAYIRRSEQSAESKGGSERRLFQAGIGEATSETKWPTKIADGSELFADWCERAERERRRKRDKRWPSDRELDERRVSDVVDGSYERERGSNGGQVALERSTLAGRGTLEIT